MQGLNAPQALHILRNFYKEQLHNLDILCIQEHKLRGQKLTDLGSQIWHDAIIFAFDASVAYNHFGGDEGARSGSIYTLLSPKIKQHHWSQSGAMD